MIKKTIGFFFVFIIITAFLWIQYIVLDRVLKQPSDLTEIWGVIEDVRIIKTPKRFFGYNFAFELTLKDLRLKFAISENNSRAFDFLKSTDIKGKRVRILYDKKGHNSPENLTYHVYLLRVDKIQILGINESRQTDKFGLGFFLLCDLFVVTLIFVNYFKKSRNKKLLIKNY